jgi:hypothetical protein
MWRRSRNPFMIKICESRGVPHRLALEVRFDRKHRDAGTYAVRHNGTPARSSIMSFRVLGLDPGQCLHLTGLSDSELARAGAKRYVVDAMPGFPDRIEVRDLKVGEQAILLNYEHQPAETPYRSRHAIFVREGADCAVNMLDALPEAIRIRPISLRAFNAAGEMVDADLADGAALVPLIERFLANPDVPYLHAHYAKRDCYAARIERA